MNPNQAVRRGFLAVAIATSFAFPRPAAANGAASTRNILFGTAAAAAGTLLVINHNKQVHARYAEDERRQAAAQAQANQSQAAYESERQAYEHQSAIVSAYRREVAYRARQVEARDREISALKHSLIVAKYGAARVPALVNRVAYRVPSRPVTVGRSAPVIVAARPASTVVAARPAASYGWGTW